jgi:hypothetical protein
MEHVRARHQIIRQNINIEFYSPTGVIPTSSFDLNILSNQNKHHGFARAEEIKIVVNFTVFKIFIPIS